MSDDSNEDSQVPCCSRELQQEPEENEDGRKDSKTCTTGTSPSSCALEEDTKDIHEQESIPKISNKGFNKRYNKKNPILVGRVEKPKQRTKRRLKAKNIKPKRDKKSIKSKYSSHSKEIRNKNRQSKDKSYWRETSASSNSSDRSETSIRSCKYCGHRCCRRKYIYEKKSQNANRPKKLQQKMKKTVKRRTKFNTRKVECASVQVGSRSSMLSPLCISKNLTQIQRSTEMKHCEVTPDMIVKALKDLTMWKEAVNTEAIMNFLMRTFPVNPNKKELLEDLTEKLRIAEMVEILYQTPQGAWILNHALQKRKLTKTHVSLFWKAYVDTMKPVTKKNVKENQKPPEDIKTNQQTVALFDEEYI